MPKKHTVTPVDLKKTVMAKVKSNQISMKPRWYFVLGSLFMMVGFIGLSIGAIFLTNLALFLFRKQGMLCRWRLELILNSFPLWIPILAIVGTVFGIWMLKKYDFSYKNNFALIAIGFIASIILAAFVLDYFGLNEAWSKRGPMRRFYQQFELKSDPLQKGRGNGVRRQIQYPY